MQCQIIQWRSAARDAATALSESASLPLGAGKQQHSHTHNCVSLGVHAYICICMNVSACVYVCLALACRWFVVVFISCSVVFYFGFSLLRGFFLNCIFGRVAAPKATRVCALMYVMCVCTYVCVYMCLCERVCLAKYQNYLDTNITENRIGSILDCCCWLILSFLVAGQTCLCLSVTQSIRLSPKVVHSSFSFRMPFAFHSVDFVAALLVSAASFGSLPLPLLQSASLPLRLDYYARDLWGRGKRGQCERLIHHILAQVIKYLTVAIMATMKAATTKVRAASERKEKTSADRRRAAQNR